MGVGVGVLELAVRVIAPQQLVLLRPDIWMPVDTFGWTHRPNIATEVNTGERSVRMLTDEEGFRVGQAGRRERADSILLIGDSFLAALQVEYEQSVPGLLEDSLVGPDGAQVAVRNTAVGGWDPDQYFLMTRDRLGRFAYGVALVFVYVGNDITDDVRPYFPPRQPAERAKWRVPRSLHPREWIDAVARPLNNDLEENSHLFVLVKNRAEPIRIRLGLSAAYIPWVLIRDRRDGVEWEATADVLARIDSLATAQGTPARFVLIPSQYQVDQQLFDSHVEAFGLDASTLDLDQPSTRMREELEERGLYVIDALEPFRQAHRGGLRLYGKVDPHLSPAGHRVLYDLVAPTVIETLWDSGR